MPWDTSFRALARDASSTRRQRSSRSTWTTTAATAARGETQKLQTMTQRLRRGTKGAPPWSTSEIRKIYPIWAKLLFAQASFVLAGNTGIGVHCRGYSTLYTNTFSVPNSSKLFTIKDTVETFFQHMVCTQDVLHQIHCLPLRYFSRVRDRMSGKDGEARASSLTWFLTKI